MAALPTRLTTIDPHAGSVGGRLNWLRAAVLGANDGIVSTAGLVAGVAGATADRTALLTAGVAGLLAGSLSMAVGEYVSVSTQRDTEKALIALETRELRDDPEGELSELAGFYEDRGMSPPLARQVAVELTARDALGAHLEVEMGIDPKELTNPWHAAVASFGAFFVGALIPLVAILIAPRSLRIPITLVAVVVGLGITGWLSARLGRAPVPRAVMRNIGGGTIVMGITYAVGALLGATGVV